MSGRIAYYGGIVTNGLVLDLDAGKRDSYPGSGTVWNDVSGFRNNGTLINGPTFNSANGGSIVFDGVDDYCDLGSSANSLIQGKTNFTISVWVNMISLNPLRGLIGTLNYGCGANLGLVSSNTLLSFYNDNPSTCYSVGLSGFMEINKWIYAVGTYDGVTTTIYGFKDGNLSINSGVGVKTGNSNIFSSTFQVFGDHYGPYYTNAYGSVASVYNRTLSSAEVLQNYNAQKSRFGL
jgi:hypothetical protein